jgi:hypothetical protein
VRAKSRDIPTYCLAGMTIKTVEKFLASFLSFESAKVKSPSELVETLYSCGDARARGGGNVADWILSSYGDKMEMI